jgi:rhamnulokinase
MPEKPKRLHIIGGGSQNDLLNQYTADALGIPVWAGPVEATAMGNILVQAMASGEIANMGELREVVRRSVTPKVFEPQKA